MAQVRKFQSGGKTFKINGKTYNTSNSEDMKRLEEMASNSEYGGIAQQILANVNDAAYDNTLNVYRTSDGRVVMEGGLQNVADQYMSQGAQKATQRKDNAWNNTFKRKSGKDWINNLDSFLNAFNVSSSVKTPDPKSSDKIKVEKVNGSWKYNDKDGGWDEASVDNNLMLKRWNLLKDYVSAEDKSKYDVSGLDQDKLSAFIDMYKADPNLFKKYEPYFKANAARPSDFSDFYSTFGWFGFEDDPIKVAEIQQQNEEDAYKKRFIDAGYDYEKWAPYVDIDDKGNVTARKDDQGKSVFAALGGNGNYWFNDNFTAYSPENSFLKGHFLIGDKIYKESDANKIGSDLYNYLRKSGGFYDLNNTGQYDASNSLINWMWGSNAYIRPETETNLAGDFYNSGVRIDNTNYRTGDTSVIGSDYELMDGDQIIKYVNLNNPSNEYGLRNENYAIVDRFGNVRTHNGVALRDLNENYFSNLLSGILTPEQNEAQQILREKRVSTDKDDNLYYNRYAMTGSPYFDLYVNPSSNEDVIMSPKGELTNTWLDGNKKGIRISKEIAEILQKPEFIKALQTDPDFAKKFRNTIQGLTGTDVQDLFKRNLNKISEFPGIKEEDARKIIEFFYDNGANVSKLTPYARRNADYIVNRPQFKNGGALKLQTGGAINAGSKQNELKLKIEEPVKSHTEQARLGIDKLSAAEKAELASIGMDVLGTAAGFLGPIGDIVGSSVGIAASATQLGADISRAGRLTGKDALRFARNVGLDALGLVPVLGDASRAVKTIKNVQKISKWLSPLFIGAGLTSAAGSVDKIMNGETLTVDDWGNLAAGFQAITNLGIAGKRRYDMSKIASLNSKLPKNVSKPEYKYSIGNKTITLGEGQVGNVTSKNKKDAQEYLASLFTKEGVEEKDIPKDLAKKFGFVEGKTRWGKISEPKKEKQIENRSTAGFFFRPGLSGYLEKNKNTLGRAITSGDLYGNRTAASLSKEFGLGLPTYIDGWTRYGSPKVVNYGNLPQPQTADVKLPYFNIRPTNMPWIKQGQVYERSLVPTGFGTFRGNEFTFRRNPDVTTSSDRAVNDIKPPKQRRKPLRIVAPETHQPAIIIDKNGKVVSMNRIEFNKSTTNDLGKLYVRFKKYQDALKKVNSEKSFRKIIENMANDIEFKTTMEENPGLLRQEMLDAANRVGILGKNRKDLVKGLVFKEGGILKADTGLKFDFKPKTYTGKLNSFNNFKIKSDLLDPNYKPITGVGERIASQVMTKTTPSFGTMYDAFGKEIDTKLTPNNSPVKTVSQSSTQDASQTISQMGGRPSGDKSFNTALFSRDALGIANYLRANKESEDLYTIDKNIADITGRRTVKAPNILTNRRFMTNTNNQYNDLIGKYNTSIGQQITNDAFANMTARLIGADKTAGMMRDMNRELSAEFNNAQDRWQQNWQQQQLYNANVANKNNEIQVASAITGEQARANKLTRDSQRRNLAYNSLQDRLHNLGTIDANAKMQSYMYKDLAAKAITPEQKSAYDNLSAQVLSNDFLNAKKQQAGLWWAKRGGKFRPTKDQLLLDNQKIVAKAIEKINDNTMKLILKAMS